MMRRFSRRVSGVFKIVRTRPTMVIIAWPEEDMFPLRWGWGDVQERKKVSADQGDDDDGNTVRKTAPHHIRVRRKPPRVE